MYLPEWALPFKEKGTEIKKINNGFYKYEDLKYFGKNREKVVGWMQTLLKDIPEAEQNYVLLDSTHSVTVQFGTLNCIKQTI